MEKRNIKGSWWINLPLTSKQFDSLFTSVSILRNQTITLGMLDLYYTLMAFTDQFNNTMIDSLRNEQISVTNEETQLIMTPLMIVYKNKSCYVTVFYF